MENRPPFFDFDTQEADDSSWLSSNGLGLDVPQTFHHAHEVVPFPADIHPQITPSLDTSMLPPPATRSPVLARASAQSKLGRYQPASSFQRPKHISSASNHDTSRVDSSTLTNESLNTPNFRLSGPSIAANISPPDTFGYPNQPSNSRKALFPSSVPLLPRRKRVRKPRTKPNLSAAEEDAKREKYLERNRVAADKCRVRRKTWTTNLEDTESSLKNYNVKLRLVYSALVNEAREARAMLMVHAHCGDARINQWIENEAKCFANSIDERYSTMPTNFGFTSISQSRPDSTPSVSGYTTIATNELLSPTQSSSLSRHFNMSSPQHESMSLSQDIEMPNSAVLFQTQAPSNLDGGSLPLFNNTYTIGQAVDQGCFDNISNRIT